MDNKINIINLIFANKLGFSTLMINIKVPKSDELTLKTFKMAMISFLF